MFSFEQYLSDFSNTINLWDFLVNLLVATILSMVLKFFYIRFSTSFSDRSKFAGIFVPLSLATLLIITVVQSSIALSLGLVGALSIVRFRAAIKEPEELTYLFLTIAIGLTTGANKPLLAIVAIFLILPLIYLNSMNRGKKLKSARGKMFVNITTSKGDVGDITKLVTETCKYVNLVRMDSNEQRLYLSYMVNLEDSTQLARLHETMKNYDPAIELSIIDQPDLIL